MKVIVAAVLACCSCAWVAGVRAEERAWEVRGAFVSLKPGHDDVAIIELPDGSLIEVPLSALSDEGRTFVLAQMESTRGQDPAGAVTAKGPQGRSVALAVPEILKGVETDAIWCRTAEDAVLVYRLYLAGEEPTAEQRAAAEKRLAEWRTLAEAKKVRMGQDWVAPEQLAEARSKADEMVRHSIELTRLGNWELAEEQLRDASRVNPEAGIADLVLGLGYALLRPSPSASVRINLQKAIGFFEEAGRREPDNPDVLNNLGVCEMLTGRYASGVAHLKRAWQLLDDDQTIADNLGLTMKNATAIRPRVPEKLIAELNACYRAALQNPRLKPLDMAVKTPLKLRSLYGAPIPFKQAELTVTELVSRLKVPDQWQTNFRAGEGFAVAEGYVLASSSIVRDATELAIEDPTTAGRWLPAKEVASLESPAVSLLRCDGLLASTLPLAEKVAAAGVEVAMPLEGATPLVRTPEMVRGTVSGPVQPDLGGGSFIHTAAIARGVGGGPIVDQNGSVVGMVASVPETANSGNERGVGIPIERIWPLLKEQLPDLKPSSAPSSAGWADVEAKAAGGVVRVNTRVKYVKKPK